MYRKREENKKNHLVLSRDIFEILSLFEQRSRRLYANWKRIKLTKIRKCQSRAFCADCEQSLEILSRENITGGLSRSIKPVRTGIYIRALCRSRASRPIKMKRTVYLRTQQFFLYSTDPARTRAGSYSLLPCILM